MTQDHLIPEISRPPRRFSTNKGWRPAPGFRNPSQIHWCSSVSYTNNGRTSISYWLSALRNGREFFICIFRGCVLDLCTFLDFPFLKALLTDPLPAFPPSIFASSRRKTAKRTRYQCFSFNCHPWIGRRCIGWETYSGVILALSVILNDEACAHEEWWFPKRWTDQTLQSPSEGPSNDSIHGFQVAG